MSPENQSADKRMQLDCVITATLASRRTKTQLHRDLEEARRLAEQQNQDKDVETRNNEQPGDQNTDQTSSVQGHTETPLDEGFNIDDIIKRLTTSVTRETSTVVNLQVPPPPISHQENCTALHNFESKFTDEDFMNKLSQEKDATTRAEDATFKEEVRQFMQEVRSNMDEDKKFKNK
ncbi:hypothetical protein LI328DRAFT_171176 [Trichoderma asperelloides]|nr:hypothetical protein LI328DRAFT_171176 [Trichoderma asperelloides]